MTEERFIKLTQRDNRSIWLNARFIVTIEPHKDGGALVVPMGDGMDYEVRESAETVVSLCAGEVVAAPRQADAQRRQQQKQPQRPEAKHGQQGQPGRQTAQRPAAEGEKTAATTVSTDEGKPVETAAAPAVSEAKTADAENDAVASAPAAVAEPALAIAVSPVPAEEAQSVAETPAKPAKKARTRTAKSKKSSAAASAPAADAAAAPEAEAKPAEEKAAEERTAVLEKPAASEKPAQAARKPGGAQSDEEILARAAKLGCRSRTRLMNTLKSQFGKTEDAAAALVAAWAEKGELSIDGNGHVEWTNRKGVAE